MVKMSVAKTKNTTTYTATGTKVPAGMKLAKAKSGASTTKAFPKTPAKTKGKKKK